MLNSLATSQNFLDMKIFHENGLSFSDEELDRERRVSTVVILPIVCLHYLMYFIRENEDISILQACGY